MRKVLLDKPLRRTKQPADSKKFQAAVTDHILHHLAFDNSFQANIITIVSSGKIIIANAAACKLLGYSKRELLTMSRSTIFDIKTSAFKSMLKQRTSEGHSKALVTAIKKNGKLIPAEITSATFMDEDGIEKAITTIADMSLSILKQKEIDAGKEKIVADDIALAKSEQKDIDIRKEKIVAYNIDLVRSEQKDIDSKKTKIVADDIALAKSNQKEIDIQKDKLVADNIDLAISNQKKIDIKREKTVADDIALVKSNQKEIDTQKDKLVADNINLAISNQKKIDIKREKTVADDIVLAKSKQKEIDTKKNKLVADNIILALAKSDARLAENNEWIKYIAKASYDVMWDWDISTGQIYVGESITEVFGYSVKDNLASFKDFCKCLLREEKDVVRKKLLKILASHKKSWNDTFMFRRYDGSVASTTSRASIIRNEKGKAIRLIGAIQDISRLQELEKDLEDQIAKQDEQGEKYLLAAQLSFDVMWDWNLLTNEVFIGEGFEELFGYAIKSNKGNMITDWSNYIHADDKVAIEKKLHDTLQSTAMYWEQAYRITKADGSIAKVFARARIIRNAEGKAYKMIGALQDVSRQNELEEKLDLEIRSKEKQITEAMEEATETERSNIGRELHDNVNQLLGVSKLYLDLAKRGGDKSEMYMGRSSQYTLSAIEEIRKLTKGLTTEIIKNLGLCEAINNICIDTMEVNPVRISHSLESFTEDNVKEKFKMNIFRIVQEQLNNILKHAKATKVLIDLTQSNDTIRLAISDNGVGFDMRQKQKGIGIANIKRRAASYNGTAEFISQPGEGCFLKVAFPVKDALMKN